MKIFSVEKVSVFIVLIHKGQIRSLIETYSHNLRFFFKKDRYGQIDAYFVNVFYRIPYEDFTEIDNILPIGALTGYTGFFFLKSRFWGIR